MTATSTPAAPRSTTTPSAIGPVGIRAAQAQGEQRQARGEGRPRAGHDQREESVPPATSAGRAPGPGSPAGGSTRRGAVGHHRGDEQEQGQHEPRPQGEAVRRVRGEGRRRALPEAPAGSTKPWRNPSTTTGVSAAPSSVASQPALCVHRQRQQPLRPGGHRAGEVGGRVGGQRHGSQGARPGGLSTRRAGPQPHGSGTERLVPPDDDVVGRPRGETRRCTGDPLEVALAPQRRSGAVEPGRQPRCRRPRAPARRRRVG